MATVRDLHDSILQSDLKNLTLKNNTLSICLALNIHHWRCKTHNNHMNNMQREIGMQIVNLDHKPFKKYYLISK